MKHQVTLSQNEIASIVGEYFGMTRVEVELDISPEMQDGPHSTAASVEAVVSSENPLHAKGGALL